MAKWMSYRPKGADHDHYFDLDEIAQVIVEDNNVVLGFRGKSAGLILEDGLTCQQVIKYFSNRSTPLNKLGEFNGI